LDIFERKVPSTKSKLQKNTVSMKFFPKKFAQFRKTYYLCTRNQAKQLLQAHFLNILLQ